MAHLATMSPWAKTAELSKEGSRLHGRPSLGSTQGRKGASCRRRPAPWPCSLDGAQQRATHRAADTLNDITPRPKNQGWLHPAVSTVSGGRGAVSYQ